MNSREISELFTNYDSFNPIETFGNRLSAASNKKTQRQIRENVRQNMRDYINEYQTSSSKIKKKMHDIKGKQPKNQSKRIPVQDQNNEDQRSQTRIRLLTSFQQSYLESVSQPTFTEGDHGSNLKPQQSNQLSYSLSKKSQNKVDRYVETDPNQYTYGQLYTVQPIQQQLPKLPRQSSNPTQKNLQQKIKTLQLSIEQQKYNLSIQDRIYEFLISRIENRGRASVLNQKKKDQHQIVQKAIDFMDSGQEFVMELRKLTRMQHI